MTKSRNSNSVSRILAGGAGALFCLAATALLPAEAQVLPPNPQMTCTVSDQSFNGWFRTGHATADGAVNPADSLTLDTSNNCNFYKWSAQMFLWLTSPVPAAALNSNLRVFNSSVFFQVNGSTLVPQKSGAYLRMGVRAAQDGPDGLPMVLDAKGNYRAFVDAPQTKSGAMLMGTRTGKTVSAFTVKRGANNKALFLDRKGKTLEFIPHVTAAMLPKNTQRLVRLMPRTRNLAAMSPASRQQELANMLTRKRVLIRFGRGKNAIFVEAGTGTIDNLGPGQAGGNGVLVSQKHSVIFYETLVNDVYAWYLTGRKTQGGIAPFYNPNDPGTYGYFPTSQAELTEILNFAHTHDAGANIPDPNALAIEAKLSWVDAGTVADVSKYITTTAQVPIYDRSNPVKWTPAGTKPFLVALVGAHIVGSAKGHPEMLWATFEHHHNTPLAEYQYINANGTTVTVPRNTTGQWLLSASGAAAPFNAELATLDSTTGDINAANNVSAIGPSNVLRQKAWGSASDGVPNQEDKTPAAANTQIISLDTSVQSLMTNAGMTRDPRFNYLHFGTTWTLNGGEPNGSYALKPGTYNEIGTAFLQNSTMETFKQGETTTTSTGINCFVCHVSSGSDPNKKADTDVSHIFGGLSGLQ